MAIKNLTPRQENITGSSLTGSSGGSNRTYTLAYSPFLSSSGIEITVAGVSLMFGSGNDYTVSSNVITFLNAVWNDQDIQISYFTGTAISQLSTTDETEYATTEELNRFMHMLEQIPELPNEGNTRSLENFGTGDNSTTRFYLDKAYVIDGTIAIYHGATEAAALAASALTEVTDFSVDLEFGIVTLTSAGVTAVGTDKMYAQYSFNNLNISDEYLQDALNRAAESFEGSTHARWTDGTDATPNYIQVTNEKHTGKGKFDRDYYTIRFPLPDVSTALNGAVAADDTTITVDSTAGFPSSGSLQIEDDKIDYTGKTSTTFTGCTSVEAHDDNDSVSPYVFELSTTEAGSSPTWTILQPNTDYDLDRDSGRVHIYRDDVNLDVFNTTSPQWMLPNRFRASYIAGYETIPVDIKRAVLMIAAKDVLHTAVRSAHTAGKNDFNPAMIDIDEAWIESTIAKNRSLQMVNT